MIPRPLALGLASLLAAGSATGCKKPGPKPIERKTRSVSVSGKRTTVLGGAFSLVPPEAWTPQGDPMDIKGFNFRFPNGGIATFEFGRLPRDADGNYGIYGVKVSAVPKTLIYSVQSLARSRGGQVLKSGDLGPYLVGGLDGQGIHVTFKTPAGDMTMLHVFVETPGAMVLFRYTAPAVLFALGLDAVEGSLKTVEFPESARN